MKRLLGFVLLPLIILITASLTSGLELSASTGGNGGSSSTNVRYGATIDDYNHEHIQLNPADGTLSNAFSGSGSLPYNYISTSDTEGDYAQVYRSVSGKSGTTKWNYDWSTYKPTSSAGSGVGAWLSLTASNAYSISGGSSSSNKEGDNAQVSTYVGLSDPQTTSSLSNYYTQAEAYTNQASAYQSANFATSTYPITIAGYSNNYESDSAKADILATTGTINYPTISTIATKTSDYVYPTASSIVTPGTGTLDASTSNMVGDNTNFKLQVTSGSGYSGNILSPNYYALSQTVLSESKLVSLTSAYGATATITSHAQDLAVGVDPNMPYVPYVGGSADFEALQTNGNKFTDPTLDTKATGSGVSSSVIITPTGFPKTALLLEPFKWEFGDLYPTVGADLYSKGYAVTDYSNAGVTWNKVYQLPQNTVSLIWTHGVGTENTKGHITSSYGLQISDIGDSSDIGNVQTAQQSWAQLVDPLTNSAYQGKNDLMILDGCGTFFKNPTGLSGENVAKNAQVSGGFADTIYYPNPNDIYMKALFDCLVAGNTIGTATAKANSAVNNQQSMYLQGNTAYKLR
jgi:hypothetical protein